MYAISKCASEALPVVPQRGEHYLAAKAECAAKVKYRIRPDLVKDVPPRCERANEVA